MRQELDWWGFVAVSRMRFRPRFGVRPCGNCTLRGYQSSQKFCPVFLYTDRGLLLSSFTYKVFASARACALAPQHSRISAFQALLRRSPPYRSGALILRQLQNSAGAKRTKGCAARPTLFVLALLRRYNWATLRPAEQNFRRDRVSACGWARA